MKATPNMESIVGRKELFKTRKQVATDSMEHTLLEQGYNLMGYCLKKEK